MKNLRRLSLALMLIFVLTACGTKETNEIKPNETAESKTENIKSTIKEEDLEEIEKETEEEDELNSGSEKERLAALMDKSDYISLVELSSTADNQMELRILTNFKGNLSNVEFQYPKNLSPSKQYLIFYHDDEEGNITPTNGKNSMIEVSGSDDKILQRVQEKYTVYTGDQAESSKENNKKTTTRQSKDSSNN